MEGDGEAKKFTDHLNDLRSLILKSLLATAIGTTASFIVAPTLFKILTHPYSSALKTGFGNNKDISVFLQSLNPSDTFVMSLNLAIICGIIISLPYIIKEIWRFASPALFPSEKRFILPIFSIGFFFFLTGAVFAYFVMLPAALGFLRSYSLEFGVAPIWTITNYTSFVITILMAFGIAFELPVVVVMLTWFGILSPKILALYRKYIILGIAVISAILTPPDVASMAMMMIPLLILFELSVAASKIIAKTKLEKQTKGAAQHAHPGA